MPLILPGNVGSATAGGFNVSNSLRFQSNDYLKIDPSGDGNLTTWTTSFWVKRQFGANQTMWDAGTNGGNNYSPFFFQDNDTIRFYEVVGGSLQSFNFITNRVFRDPASWYHFVYRVDTTQGTDTNRVRLYVNGVQETSFSTAAYPAEDYSTLKNDATFEMIIGSASDNKGNDMQGYMSEFVHIDGQSLAPTSFGEFDEDSGIWKPINVDGLTFGTNGFYLQFKETGTSQNSSGIGADTSGQDNHMAVSGLAAVDQSIDTCTNNFATLNPLDPSPNPATFTDGNLNYNKTSTGAGHNASTTGTLGVTKGKWYFEFKVKDTNDFACGIIRTNHANPNSNGLYSSDSGVYAITHASKIVGGSESNKTVSYSADDIFGFEYDLDNGKFYVHINGTHLDEGDPTSGSTGTGSLGDIAVGTNIYVPFVSNINYGVTNDIEFNFGSPIHSISSGNADGNGFGNFEYAVPSGYFALNTKNLAEYG